MKTSPRISGLAILSIGILVLAACEAVNNVVEEVNEELGIAQEMVHPSKDFVQNECPKVEAVEELTGLYQYSDFSLPSKDNMISNVHITQTESTCVIQDKSVTVDLKMTFQGELGAQAKVTERDKPLFVYPFFVAITGPRGKIIAKEVFAASMTYDRNDDKQNYYEHLRQIIPINKPEQAGRLFVKVGFQLNQEQLAYNRALINPEGKVSQYKRPQPPSQEEQAITQTISEEDAAALAIAKEAEMIRTQQEAAKKKAQETTVKIVRPERPKRYKEEVVVPYGMQNDLLNAEPPQSLEPSSGELQTGSDASSDGLHGTENAQNAKTMALEEKQTLDEDAPKLAPPKNIVVPKY